MTDQSDLAAALAGFRDIEVLCLGDVMLDRFVYGEAERISPEAPIPVVRITREAAMPGGAGNVAANLSSLGARVTLAGVRPALLSLAHRATTIKTRYFAGSQQMLRADREETGALDSESADRLRADIRTQLGRADAVILSDYGKGVLADGMAVDVIGMARQAGTPVIVDPKGDDYARYRGASLVTPNLRELAAASGQPPSTLGETGALVAAAGELCRAHDLGAVLVTRSADGMTLVTHSGEILHRPAEAREVFDVSGAGDTVAAVMGAALARRMTPGDAMALANLAAGIVVGRRGTASVAHDELVAALHAATLMTGAGKVVSIEEAARRVAAWRQEGLSVGFTNGCFDLLHPGHVSLLAQARGACDRLVVGLNSDASVTRLKGRGRPVQSEAARAAVLASLANVDLVVIFGADTPIELIATLKPDVLVKGADYSRAEVVGADIVESYGGRVFLARLEDGFSTTATIARMAE